MCLTRDGEGGGERKVRGPSYHLNAPDSMETGGGGKK